MNRLLSLDPRRICVIKPSALGDVIQALPVASALAARFPKASIAWVIQREFMELLEGHPALAELIAFDRRAGLRRQLRFLRDLRRHRFDVAIDLQGLLRSAAMCWATGARVRMGLQTAREGAALACNVVIPKTSRHVPAHGRYWRVAEALGAAECPRTCGICLAPTDHGWVYEQLRGLPRPLLAIHPGARWATKRWPAERFASIAARFRGSVVIVGSASERELARDVCARASQLANAAWRPGLAVAGSAPKPMGAATKPPCGPERHSGPAAVLNLAGATSLKRLAALFAACDLVLANDSGPMHLAAAMGAWVVGVFTCTDAALSGPAGDGHELVSTRLECGAGYHKRCPLVGPAHLACHQEIDVERVWRAVERALAGRQALQPVA